ncbi:MAG: hypothetical protein JOZ60_14560 [Verrucomicrobia bacterium]|nr:hypothetical protein [Verrucomicrobiota bacterium]
MTAQRLEPSGNSESSQQKTAPHVDKPRPLWRKIKHYFISVFVLMAVTGVTEYILEWLKPEKWRKADKDFVSAVQRVDAFDLVKYYYANVEFPKTLEGAFSTIFALDHPANHLCAVIASLLTSLQGQPPDSSWVGPLAPASSWSWPASWLTC